MHMKKAEKLYDEANKAAATGDYKGAVILLQKASDLGHVYATTNLGICYYYGDGCIQSIDKAKKLFSQAATRGEWRPHFILDKLLEMRETKI